MAVYFFHLHECGEVTPDEDGREAATLEDARIMAVAAARGIMCEEVRAGRLCLSCHVQIADPEGRILLDVPFREAITVTGYSSDA